MSNMNNLLYLLYYNLPMKKHSNPERNAIYDWSCRLTNIMLILIHICEVHFISYKHNISNNHKFTIYKQLLQNGCSAKTKSKILNASCGGNKMVAQLLANKCSHRTDVLDIRNRKRQGTHDKQGIHCFSMVFQHSSIYKYQDLELILSASHKRLRLVYEPIFQLSMSCR